MKNNTVKREIFANFVNWLWFVRKYSPRTFCLYSPILYTTYIEGDVRNMQYRMTTYNCYASTTGTYVYKNYVSTNLDKEATVCGLMLERKGMWTTLSLQACKMCYAIQDMMWLLYLCTCSHCLSGDICLSVLHAQGSDCPEYSYFREEYSQSV